MRRPVPPPIFFSGLERRFNNYWSEAQAKRWLREAWRAPDGIDDLTPAQRWLFDRTLTQMDGAYHANGAQRERTMLALKQSELDKDKMRAIGQTFDRQLRVMEQRFWLLVDVTLDVEQKVWIWEHLPQTMRRKSQAIEHLYTLPGLSGSQGTRLRALVTEIEHESSPDNAAVLELGGA